MKCHLCGQREATVHLLELIEGRQKSVWLCSICAAGRAGVPHDDSDGPDFGRPAAAEGESASLASFLGQGLDSGGQRTRVAACSSCGYEIKAFQDNNRLGCAACYSHFRQQLLPILARYHRHASHLGKVPRQAGGVASQQGALIRLRVALEKAIQSESYEEAARLRDEMRALRSARDRSRDLADDPDAGQDPV